MFIDTHCHIDDEKYTDRESVIKNFINDGVVIAINMGTNLQSTLNGLALSKEHKEVYFGAGYHPSDIEDFDGEKREKIEQLLTDKKCVAVGEIGLDYHFEPFDKNKQIEGFIYQIELASKYHLPFSIHSRDATKDTLDILKERKNLLSSGAIMHCYSGSIETAKELLKLGVYISFGGTLTFKNSLNLKEVAKTIPIDFILTETDSPYLSPVPFRGQTNEPKNVSLVTAYLAELRGEKIEKIASCVMANAKRLFKKLA